MPCSKILIIEDDHDTRVTLRTILEDAEYRVASATNGLDGLRLLRKDPEIRLVLLDVMLPFMNGHDFLRELRKDVVLAPTPVVAISAQQVRPEGAAQFIRKPIDHSTLLRVVENYCVEVGNRPSI